MFGVRSPPRCGKKVRPRAPGGEAARAASICAWSRPNTCAIQSVATVQFNVHTSGSQAPVESQKAAASPRGSTPGSARYANAVPDVPRLTTTGPSHTAPVPIAAIMLSPPPALTGTPDLSPSAVAAVAHTPPASDSESITGGKLACQAPAAASAA